MNPPAAMVMAEPYQTPNELHALLRRWGASLYSGIPANLGYPKQSCGGYSVATKEPYESEAEKAEYAKLNHIIDVILIEWRVVMLQNRYRKNWPLRLCVKQFQMTEAEYLERYYQTIRKVEELMKQDLSGYVDLRANAGEVRTKKL